MDENWEEIVSGLLDHYSHCLYCSKFEKMFTNIYKHLRKPIRWKLLEKLNLPDCFYLCPLELVFN